MKQKISVSVVIPNWNGKKWLKVCLPSLLRQSRQDFEVIVVDNGSIDGSSEYVGRYFPHYRVVGLSQNLGFAGGVNAGIKLARGENIVLLNNDMRLDRDFLRFMVSAAENKSVGLVGAQVRQYYQPKIIDSIGDYIDVAGHANNIGRGERVNEIRIPEKVYLVTGGACLIKRQVLETVGLFDEDYFAYMEDVDLSLRAQFAGYRAIIEPKAIAYHVHKATSSGNRKLLEYWQFRNMTMNIIKDFPSCVIWYKWNWLKILLVNINTVRYFAKEGLLGSALRAEWYVISHFGQLLRKRSRVQALIKVDDDYLRSIFVDRKVKIPFVGWRI